MSDEENDGDQAASSSNYDSSSMDDCELIENNSSGEEIEEIEETPLQSAAPSSQPETTSQQDLTSATQESGTGAIKL